jgi:hypothetical protein
MPDMIKDGSGGGYNAKVNENNRLYVNAVQKSNAMEANTKGNAYNLNTGGITLTNAADTPIMYVKNNEAQDLNVTAIAVGVGPTTGGTGEIPEITIVRNPTGGTIVSNATAIDIESNRNYGSSNIIDIDAYKGATGDTMTGGTDSLYFFQTSNGRLFATIDQVLPKGSSIGIKFDPQAGNTSQKVYCALISHLSDVNE